MSDQNPGGMWLFGRPKGSEPEPVGEADPVPADPAIGAQAPLPAVPRDDVPPAAGPGEPRQADPLAAADTAQASPDQPPWMSGPTGPATAQGAPPPPLGAPRAPEQVSAGPTASGAVPPAPQPGGGGARRRPSTALLVVGVLVLGLAVGGGVAWAALKPDPPVAANVLPNAVPDATSSASLPTPSPTESESASASPTTSASEPSASETSSSEDEEEAADRAAQDEAHRELDELADDGLNRVDLDGQRAAMIASKWNGIKDPLQETASGSHVFHYADILAEHQRLAGEDNVGAQVVLLRSTDYGRRSTSPTGKKLYVTLALGDFSSEDDVQAWCDERFADLSAKQRDNTCVPTKLTE